MFKNSIFVVLILFYVGCSGDEAAVQDEFERFLGKSFKGEFIVIESEYSFAIGDDVMTVIARFTKEGLKNLIATLPPQELKDVENGRQFLKTLPVGYGHDFIILHISNNSDTVFIQFGHE